MKVSPSALHFEECNDYQWRPAQVKNMSLVNDFMLKYVTSELLVMIINGGLLKSKICH